MRASNRCALIDNWRPLLAIADVAGGKRPERARRIAESAKRAEETVGGDVFLNDCSDLVTLLPGNARGAVAGVQTTAPRCSFSL